MIWERLENAQKRSGGGLETVWERRENVQKRFARNGLGEARKCSEIKWSERGLETVWERPRNGLGEARKRLETVWQARNGLDENAQKWSGRGAKRHENRNGLEAAQKNLETVWEPPKTVLNPNPKS